MVCARTGDLSPIMPLDMRTAIRLQVAVSLLEKNKAEAEFQKSKLMVDLFRNTNLLLCDIRQAAIDQLMFKDKRDKIEYFKSLPSMQKEDEEKPKPNIFKVHKLQPGEDWRTVKMD